MVEDRRTDALMRMVSERIKTFTPVEKTFYGTIVLTALLLAIGIIFMQARLLQVQSEMASLNQEIYKKQIELNDAKQAVNELVRSNRMMEIAEKYELVFNNDAIGVAE